MIRPRLRHGREDPGARGDHDAGFAGADAPPLLGAFGVVKRRVQNRDSLAEALMELARRRRE